MRMSTSIKAGVIALAALATASLSSAALADSGSIRFTVYKAGWFVGGSGGEGTLTFRGRNYPVSIGGLSAGLVFGASKTTFYGYVRNIQRPSDATGVYGAGGAGGAIGNKGAGVIVLSNSKGAVMEISGRQVGLIANLDLSGIAITLR